MLRCSIVASTTLVKHREPEKRNCVLMASIVSNDRRIARRCPATPSGFHSPTATSVWPLPSRGESGWTETRDAGAQAFGSTKKYKKLKKLDLRGNFLASKTKEELRKLLGHLQSLKLF